jgi:hypothetical protein
LRLPQVVKEVESASVGGKTFKQEPALLVLALCARASDAAVRSAALVAMPKVARTPTMLFTFVAFVQVRAPGLWTGCKRAQKKLELRQNSACAIMLIKGVLALLQVCWGLGHAC